MYVYSVILHWGCFIELVAYDSSYVNFQEALISLCLSCYVFYVWETSDLFLGTPDHCFLHHYIHWWFDRSPWLDLSGLVLIHFPLIYLFLSWYFIRLGYIVLCTYRFIFRVQYFSTRHSYTSHQQFDILHFFFFITNIFIFDSFFLTDIFTLDVLKSIVYETLCTYCILYTRVWDFTLGLLSLVSNHFFTLLP